MGGTRSTPGCSAQLDVLVGEDAVGKAHSCPEICLRHPTHILAPARCSLCQTLLIKEIWPPAGSHSYREGEYGDLLVSGEGSLNGAQSWDSGG